MITNLTEQFHSARVRNDLPAAARAVDILQYRYALSFDEVIAVLVTEELHESELIEYIKRIERYRKSAMR
ncbi:TPA: hypothetical protein QDZ84_003464 [Shewanella algae]|uniref:hypothetical protein n=1 Tax=Shewanella TaxID=22 RepID=UPI0014300BB1|nr:MULTISPECIES: hypothetical protein [Shewanella]NJI86930.1 hypothetical protein [Shewanella sp. Iso12]HDS1208425.1 hypothetical protein [Shewanella algae]